MRGGNWNVARGSIVGTYDQTRSLCNGAGVQTIYRPRSYVIYIWLCVILFGRGVWVLLPLYATVWYILMWPPFYMFAREVWLLGARLSGVICDLSAWLLHGWKCDLNTVLLNGARNFNMVRLQHLNHSLYHVLFKPSIVYIARGWTLNPVLIYINHCLNARENCAGF
jgi:hypothetical protein